MDEGAGRLGLAKTLLLDQPGLLLTAFRLFGLAHRKNSPVLG